MVLIFAIVSKLNYDIIKPVINMKYYVLASGSKGNATFIEENGTGILIDCGITKKQLNFKLSELGLSEDDTGV